VATNKVIKEALEKAGLSASIKGLNYIVSTGYARGSIGSANKTVTEIICHAKGAQFVIPSTRFILSWASCFRLITSGLHVIKISPG